MRESARVLAAPTVPQFRTLMGVPAAERRPDVFMLIPSVALADGLTIAGGSAAYIFNNFARHPLQVRGGFRKLDLDDETAEDRTQVSLDAKMPLISRTNTTVTAFGGVGRVLDLSTKLNLGGAAERSFGPLTLAGNLEYVRSKREATKAVEDLVPSVGATYSWAAGTDTSLDYVFKNDVDGEYDLSFTLAQRLSQEHATSLFFGVARHRTVFVTVVRAFTLGGGTRASALARRR